MAASLVVLILTSQLLLWDLQACDRGVAAVQNSHHEETEVALLQLEQSLTTMRLNWPKSSQTQLALIDQKGKSFLLTFKLRDGQLKTKREVVLTNPSNAGYMPLFFQVRSIKWQYQAPLLELDLVLLDRTHFYRTYLVKSV
ncbi:ComGF family competence protein [Lapidilactobacillus luobeiensis]|uniref:ComGF family competence protein n=1 Tax=Lapidilactobacillus luobeiensis TaxID=2950371 RepID=UPI0021C3490B|nr:ComGF family competence protein [Lapidilactobacillus luobeiensis]